jgi:hypothetical protein
MEPSPLSGEWADGPTPASVLAELGVPDDSEDADDALSEYERGHSEGYWAEVLRAARVYADTAQTEGAL